MRTARIDTRTIGARLARHRSSVRGDWMFGERLRHRGPFRPASVLLLLRDGPDGAEMLLTKRSATLTLHPGDIAFPGGQADPTDTDAVDTALRETEEEVGVPRRHITVLGRLDAYEGAIGFRLDPIVATAPADVSLAPHDGEVAAVAWVALRDLASRLGVIDVPWRDGGTRRSHAIPVPAFGPDAIMWGMTAGIAVALLETLGMASAPAAPATAG